METSRRARFPLLYFLIDLDALPASLCRQGLFVSLKVV